MPEPAPPLDPLRERVVLMAEIGPGRYFRIIVRGPWTVKECDRVLAHLELLRQWHREDEASAADPTTPAQESPP